MTAVGVSAGFPQSLGLASARDYSAACNQMAGGGIKALYPVDTYQLVPQFASLGWLEDFLPPKVYELTNPAIAALKANGIRLIINGGLFYPPNTIYPSIANDPLKRLIQAHGSDFLLGIWGHDEPTHSGIPLSESQKLRDRRNMVLPSLPIFMCHAPMKAEATWDTAAKRSAYLAACVQQSAYADVIMFDVYPFPCAVQNLLTPAGGATVAPTWQEAVGGYKTWLDSNFPTKQRGIVLQAFSLSDFYSDAAVAGMGLTRPQAEIAYPGPTASDIAAMKTFMSNEAFIGYYGPSFQKTDQEPDWLNIL